MTKAIALEGQWEGLRAIPRGQVRQDRRQRLEAGLERLGGLYEAMAARAALLNAGLDRLAGLREAMIMQLDAVTPDPDLEDGGDDEHNGDLEPSLGSIESWSAPQTGWASGNSNDLEGEHDGREPSEDDEFTLGRTEGIDQTKPQWGSDDAEDVSEDEGAQCEGEGEDFDAELEPDAEVESSGFQNVTWAAQQADPATVYAIYG